MRRMNGGVTDSVTWSRMAILAVHALLLSAGPLSTCHVEAAAAGAAANAGWPGWSALSSVVAALPHNNRNLPTHPSSTAASPKRNKLFQGQKDETKGCHSCNTKRSSMEEELGRWHVPGGGRRKANMNATKRNMRPSSSSSNNSRSWLGWVHAKQSSTLPKEGTALPRKVLGVKGAAATTGVVGSGVGPYFDVSRQKLREGGAARWLKRLQRTRARATSSSVRQEQGQQKGAARTKAAAVRGTRTPSQGSLAPSVVPAAAMAASSAVADTAARSSPVPSYLQWPSISKGAAAVERKDEEEAGGAGGRTRNNESLPFGAGSRAGRSRSRSSDAESTAAPSGEGDGLGAAKSSRGGGGPGAVSLTFKEAMFAGAISRSIAQVRYKHRTLLNQS